jgi:hypothetical protein
MASYAVVCKSESPRPSNGTDRDTCLVAKRPFGNSNYITGQIRNLDTRCLPLLHSPRVMAFL